MVDFDKSHKKGLLAETNAGFVVKRKKNRKRRAWLFFVFFLVIIGAFIYFAWYPKFLIQNVYLNGNQVLSNNKIENSADEYLNGRFAFILPRKNAFIFNGDELGKYLVKQYPIIKEVSFSQNIPNDLFINIIEREPYALWCNLTADCVFIDTTGYAYDTAPYFSRPLFLVYELPGAKVTERILDVDAFNFTEGVKKGLEGQGVLVQKIKPKGDNVFEFKFILPNSSVSTALTTDIETGAEETTLRFKTLLGSEDVLNHKSKTLKTIDVRFGNQVIYTFY